MRPLRVSALSLLLCLGCGGASAASEPKAPGAVTEVSLDAEGAAGPRASAEGDPGEEDADALEQARAAGILGVLGGEGDGAFAALGDVDVADSIGGLEGATVGDAFGTGGLGLSGVGVGGGGTGQGTIGLGTLGTRGVGGAGSGAGYGSGGLGRPRDEAGPQIKLGVPTVHGALEREVVHRVLRRHASSLRYCYAKEQGKASLPAGTIAVGVVIGTKGEVTASSIVTTELQNAEVESCLVARLRTMSFPAPGQGVAHVVVDLRFETPPAPAAPPQVAPAGGAAAP